MKLVDILARELKIWPEGITHVTQSNVDRKICDALDGESESSMRSLDPRFDAREFHTEDSYPIVTYTQWQAAVDALKAEKVVESSVIDKKIIRSNDDLAVLVASKTFYRFGNLFWGEGIRRKDLMGKMAGSVSATDGYRYVKCGKARNRVAAHRVIFLMHHGYLPEVIDHINRIRDDNRIENLRDALTEGNNQGNQSHQAGRSSKYKGVCWDQARGKWAAYVKQNGKRFNLGRFSSEDQAALAYNMKANELFGDFANLNQVRTPEQIEAEEREKAIEEIAKVIEDLCLRKPLRAAEMIYDAGYRKQVLP